MKATSKESFLSALRHALTALGGVAITHGYMTQSQAGELAGALPLLGGFLWGALDEYLAARKIDEDARIKAAVEAALENMRARHDAVTGRLLSSLEAGRANDSAIPQAEAR